METQANYLSQVLYGRSRKYFIFITLILMWLVVGAPFGLLGMGHNMGPIYDIDPLTGKSILDEWSTGGEDRRDVYKLKGMIGTSIISVLLVLFCIGWIFTAWRYKFARWSP